jgi:hypothetical protein
MTFRIAQISDTHLSAEQPFFVGNFERVGEALRAIRPDLVLNSGDISLSGESRESDLSAARALHEAIGLPVRFLPGNHDLGDSQDRIRPRPSISRELVGRSAPCVGALDGLRHPRPPTAALRAEGGGLCGASAGAGRPARKPAGAGARHADPEHCRFPRSLWADLERIPFPQNRLTLKSIAQRCVSIARGNPRAVMGNLPCRCPPQRGDYSAR